MSKISGDNNQVLIVDDDPVVRMMMGSVFESLDISFETAEAGEEALDIMANCPPALLLLDVMMPDLDGFEVCERMRGNHRLAEIPIVMVTGTNDMHSIQRAYNIGVTDFITKPIPWALIGYRISFILRATKSFSQLKKNESRLTHAQHLASMGSWEWELKTDKIWFSDEINRIFRFSPQDSVSSFQEFINTVHPLDRKRFADVTKNAILTNIPYSIDHKLLLTDGNLRYVHTEASVISDQDGNPIRLEGVIQDITQRKTADEEIRNLAYFDTLTGLPNRTLFLEHLKRIHIEAQRDVNIFAILFIDIDGFKTINDTLGHVFGDLLLQKLALRLKNSIRVVDLALTGMVARLGGDEFVVVINHLKKSEDVAVIAQRIIRNISEPVMLGLSEVVVTASIGISVYPDDSQNTESLVKHADIAMYSAKDNGKNSFQYFSQTMHEVATFELELEKELRMAIKNNEFTMHYQPQVDLVSKRIVGFEALIRWNSPKMGNVLPGVFIQVAEKNNLICEIDRWVISEVCRQIMLWQSNLKTDVQIAINLSARSIKSKELPAFIRQEIKKYKLAPQSLQVEITEGVLMADTTASAATLAELKGIGISLAIDDFGTGYSSLRYLHQLPFDIIKIDRSFITSITDMNDKSPVVSAIIALARNMDLDVIAEGIENNVQSDFLSFHGCLTGQGYLFSRPVSAEKVPLLLQQFQHKFGVKSMNRCGTERCVCL